MEVQKTKMEPELDRDDMKYVVGIHIDASQNANLQPLFMFLAVKSAAFADLKT